MLNLKSLFDDHEIFHSEYQMDNLITVKSGQTTFGQYKQALRELYKRYKSLKDIYIDRQELQIDIDETGCYLAKTKFEARRNKLDLMRFYTRIEDMDRIIYHTEREFKHFYLQVITLKQKIGELTIEKRKLLEQEMWTHRLKCMAAIDLLTIGRFKESTILFIQSIPVDIQDSLQKELSNNKNLVEWFSKFNNPLPKLKLDTEIDIQKLLE